MFDHVRTARTVEATEGLVKLKQVRAASDWRVRNKSV